MKGAGHEAWAGIAVSAATLAAWGGAVAFTYLDRPNGVILCLLAVIFTTTLDRPRLKKNQAIVTAPIEPSADIREGARTMAQLRVALMNEGFTSEQASRQIGDILAAQHRGQA